MEHLCLNFVYYLAPVLLLKAIKGLYKAALKKKSLPKDMLTDFREREREGEIKHLGETLVGWFLHLPRPGTGPNLQPRHVS